METKFLDFDKLTCKTHRFDLVTNYCLKSECMVGLCAQCICQHTETHMKMGTSPMYKAIKDIHKMTYQKVNQTINALQSDKNRIVNIMNQMSDRKQSFKNTLKQARKDIIRMVDSFFDQVQVKFQQQVKSEQQRTGLHSSYNIEELCKKVKKQITNLICQCTHLNSHKFLDTVKPILTNQLPEIQNLRAQIGKQLRENQEFVPKLQYKKQILPTIQSSLKKLFTLAFIYPNVKCAPNQPRPFEATQVFRQATQRPKSCMKASTMSINSTTQRRPLQMNLANSIIIPAESYISKRTNSVSNLNLRPKSKIIFEPQYIELNCSRIPQQNIFRATTSVIMPKGMTQSRFIF